MYVLLYKTRQQVCKIYLHAIKRVVQMLYPKYFYDYIQHVVYNAVYRHVYYIST